MKDKIYNALKQEYSYLGLGETVLKAQAETLANLGFITDENIDDAIKSQGTALKAIQTANDKRVADALNKVKASVDKDKEIELQKNSELQKQLEELKLQAETQTSEIKKQQEELKKQQELQKKLDDLQEKAEKQKADYEKRKADLLALITDTEQPPVAPTPEIKNVEPTIPPFDVDTFKRTMEEEFNKKISEIINSNGEQFKEVLNANKALTEQVQQLVKENTDFKVAKAAQQRRDFILSKAKELQIPDWRISEGFSIADDADENSIVNTLTTAANNIRANVLPQGGVNIPQTLSDTPDKAVFDNIAEKLVQNI